MDPMLLVGAFVAVVAMILLVSASRRRGHASDGNAAGDAGSTGSSDGTCSDGGSCDGGGGGD